LEGGFIREAGRYCEKRLPEGKKEKIASAARI
jgi:hypothetical protein